MANNKKKRKKKKKSRKIVLLVSEVLLLVVLFVVVKFWSMFSKIDMEAPLSESEAGFNTDIEEKSWLTMEEYTNIALFGLDNRSGSNYNSGNSDSIMIASINNKTKEVRIVSVYRDTYLNVGDDKYRKVNAAYGRGGVKNAVKTLNENLDLNIKAYVCVDWNALVEAIDALGGVEIEITEKEVGYINFYVEETARGANTTAEKVTESGLVTLDGVQATSYARIRYGGGDDYKRASRQRIVLQAMLDKAKKADFSTLTRICNEVFDDIQTSLTLKDILFLAKSLTKYELVSTTGFPFDVTTMELSVTGDTVIPVDLYSNVVKLHEYLFDEVNYIPSQTVQLRSNEIINLTGVTTENTTPVDLSNLNETVGVSGTDDLTSHHDEDTEASE